MSPQGVAALYGVATFALCAGAYIALVHFALGWPAVPDVSRAQGMLMLGWYVVAGLFARNAGRRAGQGATIGQAWAGALGDLGRSIKGLVTR
jgi:hypothetical protein